MHDLSSDELIAGLHNATLEPAVMVQHIDEQTAGIEFELLRTYPWCVALTGAHPLPGSNPSHWKRWLLQQESKDLPPHP